MPESPEFKPEEVSVTAEDPSSEFVSVGQAAKLLGVSDRTARRMAGQLAASDRTADTGNGRRVRLSAMEALRGKARSGFHVETSDGQDAANVRPAIKATRTDGRTNDHPDTENRFSDTAMIAELAALRAERDGLTLRLADTASDRDAWKDQAGRLDTRLAEALEALQRSQDAERSARLIGQRSASLLSPLETSDGSQSSPSVSGGVIDRPEAVERPWWAFWKGRG